MAEARLQWTPARRAAVDVAAEDPLAFHYLETQIGNWLWPGFTQRTTAASYYVMVAYGLWAAERAAQRYGLSAGDDSMRGLFDRWERLWAMCVCIAEDGDLSGETQMRGRDGVVAAYAASKRRFPLEYTLIDRQRELSALGAYLPSLRVHRFVSPSRLRLTPLGWALGQWMFGEPEAETTPFDEYVIAALNPRQSHVPEHVGRITPTAIGKRMLLSNIYERPALQQFLWRRLIADEPPPEALKVLPEMASVLVAALQGGVTDPRDILESLAKGQSGGRASSELRSTAQLALVFGDLSHVLRTVFDRMLQIVLAGGYEGEWGECVRAAVTPDVVAAIDEHVDRWQRLPQAEWVASLPRSGARFVQVVRRMNTQNAYHVFESVLSLHVSAQRAAGKGGSWVQRHGNTVYLRHSGYERTAVEGGRWGVGYRMEAMTQLFRDLGRVPT